MDKQADLARIRRSIDEADDAILDLIERRLDLARAMADAKGTGGGSPLRPAREAYILDRLKRRARSVSAPLVELVWRELIGHSRQAQGSMQLVLFARREPRLFEECARRHFGSAMPVEWAATADDALNAARGKPVIAVVDGKAEHPGVHAIGDVRTLAGDLIGFAYARVDDDQPG